MKCAGKRCALQCEDLHVNDRAEIEREEQNLARVLRAAGRRQDIPADMKQRWENSFRTELEAQLEKRSKRRRNILVALCAGIAVVATSYFLNIQAPTRHSTPIEVATVRGDAHYRSQAGEAAELRVGQKISAGSEIATGPSGFAALYYRGYDLRINHGTRVSLGRL